MKVRAMLNTIRKFERLQDHQTPDQTRPEQNNRMALNWLPPLLRKMTKCSVEILKEDLDKYLLTGAGCATLPTIMTTFRMILRPYNVTYVIIIMTSL